MKTLGCVVSTALAAFAFAVLPCNSVAGATPTPDILPFGCVGSNYNCNLSGQWTLTGPLPWGRTFCTATLLTNGMVLVTGGFTNADVGGGDSSYSQALLYNPATRTWRETAPMTCVRMRHTAILLNDGRVLVAGGYSPEIGPTKTAEIYDPQSETWTPIAPMLDARYSALATMLPNGKVLFCAGVDENRDDMPYSLYSFTTLKTDLFDPASGTWSQAADIPHGTTLGEIVLLPNGKVFISQQCSGWYDDANEIYDPVLDTWATAPTAQYFFSAHSATLMKSGGVLLVGGFDSPFNQGIFEPTDNSISWAPHPFVNRHWHCAGLLPNGEVLVAGGQTLDQWFTDDYSFKCLASSEAYDERTGTWRLLPPMNYPRMAASMVKLTDGSMLIVGGAGNYAETYKQFGTGVPPFSYSLASGELPYGLTLQTNGMIVGMPVIPQTNFVTVTIIDSTGASENVDLAIAVQENPAAGSESTPPSVAITSPANKSLFAAAPVLLNGTASDNGSATSRSQLAGVLLCINDGPRRFAKSSALKQWAAKVQLQAGWNTIVAQAFDKAGNSSTVSSNVYFQGDVSSVAGVYNGLFYETDGAQPRVAFRSAGAVLGMKVTVYGPYTGKLYCAGDVYTVNGSFDLKSGNSKITVPRANGDLVIDMHIDWTGQQRLITGTVSCAAEGWSSPISADLNGFTAKHKYTGTKQFTMAMQRANATFDATAQGGYSCASLSINGTGDVKMLGALADATPLSQGAKLSRTGRWPMFANLNSHNAMLLGWIDVSSGSPRGQVAYINAPTAAKIVNHAADDLTMLDTFGSAYIPASPAIQIPQGTLDVAASASATVSLNAAVLPNNAITKLPGATNILSGNIAKGTGLMTVKFQAPGQTNVTKATIGVVLQNRNAAYGAFVGKGTANPAAIYLH